MTITPISGFRNAIINGGFDVWQRGTSATAVNNSYTSADRWVNTFDGSSSATTISRQSFTLGNTISGYEPEYFLRYAQTSAGSGGSFRTICQRIEGVRTFAGQTITLSFWAKADSSRTVDTRIRQNFGSGGSANVDTLGSSINLTTSWSRYSTTVTLPSISGKTIGTGNMLEVFLFLPLNTTQTIDIWGVQVERGSIATPFEQRPIGTELSLCQRYFLAVGGNEAMILFTRGVDARPNTIIPLPVPLRTTPSPSYTGSVGVTNYWQAVGSMSGNIALTTWAVNQAVFHFTTWSGLAADRVYMTNLSAATIFLSAEL